MAQVKGTSASKAKRGAQAAPVRAGQPVYIAVNKDDAAQISALEKLKKREWNQVLGMYLVDPAEMAQAAALAGCPRYDLETAAGMERKREDEIFGNTRKQMASEANRIWLDAVNAEAIAEMRRNQNTFHYDSGRKQFWIDARDAQSMEFNKFVRQHTMRNMITATAFIPAHSHRAPTAGMQALADAFNIKDRGEREAAMADALALCAKEKVMGVPGAMQKCEDLIAVTAKNRKGYGMGFGDGMRYAQIFYECVDVYKKADKDFKREAKTVRGNVTPQRVHQWDLGDANARQIARSMAGQNLMNPRALQKRLDFAMKRPDKEEGLALARDALIDFSKGHALMAEADMCLSTQTRTLFSYDSLMKQFQNVVKTAQLDNGAGDNAQVAGRLHQMMCVTAEVCKKTELSMTAGIYSRHGLNEASFQAMQTNIQDNPRKLGVLIDQMRLCHPLLKGRAGVRYPILDPKKEPLFLAAAKKDIAELQKEHKDEIFLDPVHGAVCVEDTPKNRKAFAKWLPENQPQRERKQASYEQLREAAYKILTQNGFSIDPSKIDMTGRWRNDKKNKSLGYVISINDKGFPRLTINDLNGSKKESFVLGQMNEEERGEAKEAAYRHRKGEEAAKLQAQNECAKFVRQTVAKAKPLSPDASHAYLRKKGLSARDVPGMLFDKTGEICKDLMRNPKANVKEYEGSMIVPLCNIEGKITSAQIITADTESGKNKLNVAGAPAAGNMFVVGGYDRLKDAKCILVAEGVATAASIAKFAPKDTVVVACMSAHNMCSMSKELADRFPDAALGIMADNDVKSAGVEKMNAGITNAYRAQNSLATMRPNVSVTVAPLTRKELLAGKSDFNDSMLTNPQGTANRVAEAYVAAITNHKLNEEARQIALEHMNERERARQESEARVIEQLRKEKEAEQQKAGQPEREKDQPKAKGRGRH